MGMYQERFLLRNSYQFDSIIEEVARDEAVTIRDEAETVPYHTERLKMAERVLASERDEVIAAFYRELKDRAVRTDAIRIEAFKSNLKAEDGTPIPDAGAIPDAMLKSGLASIWNAAALIAWPDIADDTTGG